MAMMRTVIDLSGVWEFCFDADKAGIEKKYFGQTLKDTIVLPGTTAGAKKGRHGNRKETGYLTEPYHYEGYAWYSRMLDIPEECIGDLAQLVIERTRISYVWLDDTFVGTRDSFATAHVYELTNYLTKPSHKLTIMVSNVDYKTPGGHMTSPDTQTNWNGMLGRMALVFDKEVRVGNLCVTASATARSIGVTFTLECQENYKAKAVITCVPRNCECQTLVKEQREICLCAGRTVYDWQITIPETRQIALWNEYTPKLYVVTVKVVADQCSQTVLGQATVTVGFRDLHTEGRTFYLNDLPIMLRGKHDGMIFPLTGYAPMDKESWLKLFGIARDYGINHYRFHTCCPPEAAFEAADELGFYLEPELPFWGTVAGEEENDEEREAREWLLQEGFRILKAFGNHPSFVIFSLGNELWGDKQVLNEILGQYKAADKRHWYVQGSNNFQFAPVILENDDFFSGVRLAKDRLFRGSYAMCDAPQGHVQVKRPENCCCYDDAICPAQKQEELIPHIPVVSHEIGQYEIYPDFSEIEKYTGVLQPENLRIFQKRLEEKGMLHMAERFFWASGQLAVECYKRELETAFRSRELAGFQILDLQDFTGQGTALVGILNAFMENKGLVTAGQWREFCNDRVVMLRFPGYVYPAGGQFAYEILLCNVRPEEYFQAEVDVTMTMRGRDEGRSEGCGTEEMLACAHHDAVMEQTRLKSCGCGSLALPECKEPMTVRVTVAVAAKAEKITNHYDIYVYPAVEKRRQGKEVLVTSDRQKMLAGLHAGRKVLYFGGSIRKEYSLAGTYCTDFWCYPMFASISKSMGRPLPIGTMGLYMDDTHPLFTTFPTSGYTTPQWWDIVTNARAAVLDGQPVEPLIWMIDNFGRNHKLGLVYEARAGAGSLLVCQSKLPMLDSPEANWFYNSLLDYIESEHFAPTQELEEEWLCKVYGQAEEKGR